MRALQTTLRAKTSLTLQHRAPLLRRSLSILTAAVVVQGTSGFVVHPMSQQHTAARNIYFVQTRDGVGSGVRPLSSSSSSTEYQNIGWKEMVEIVDQVGDKNENNYCVIDVRTTPEVASTGSLGPGVHVISVQEIIERNVFAMEPDSFLEAYGFEKPMPDQPVVFSCAAGIRSVYACRAAAMAGYTKLINYTGGANEWFTR